MKYNLQGKSPQSNFLGIGNKQITLNLIFSNAEKKQ